ncbi:IclR family transcriptional regulator [Oceanibacterium hippocampi]|uniref:HTH-type transcriptional regulator KipR n=1 Tax=Oceanibacterium hippocampi TaxID=745714 RepID=A0A1Y5TP43_9PROT|nr:IclR family transcriptional regulator [Oceanibacterium hippocampi]SLN66466.1 HTH-type transcriptional regulator KipR [Oceanibacterium hippocampi]
MATKSNAKSNKTARASGTLPGGTASRARGAKPTSGGAMKSGAATKSSTRESSHDRLLAVLDLFSLERPSWTAEEIGSALNLTKTTLYRYLRTLGSSGLVSPTVGGGFVLGPRVIELDRLARLSDPMLRAAVPVMQRAMEHFDGLLLLCTYYRDKVMTIHHEATNQSFNFSMQRGQPFPLFRGSPSKAILANLPPHQLRTIMLHESRQIRAAGLGEDWQEFRDNMRAVRNAGVCVAYGELDPDLIGISAPIFRSAGDVAGSLTVVLTKKEYQDSDLEPFVEMAKRMAEEINKGIAAA